MINEVLSDIDLNNDKTMEEQNEERKDEKI